LELEKQVAEMPAGAENLPPPNNPSYLNLQVQLKGVNNELIALRNDRTALKNETQELDMMVQVAPEVERRYLELTRDLGLARKQYEDSKSRLMSVQRAGVLEDEELAERYVVARFPSIPYKPSFPNRPLFLVVGIFLGLTIGLLVGIAAEAFDRTIRSTRDISTILGMPPIAAIPEIFTNDDAVRARKSRFTYAATIGVVVVAAGIFVLLQRSSMI
jgi:tetrahydromethanopterin S-methyltransferase subunit B